MIGFIATYTVTTLGTTRNTSAIAILHTFQFTVTHALGFPVLTSRTLATDLSQSHYHFKAHVKSSFHSPVPFLAFILELPTQFTSKLLSRRAGVSKLDSVLDYCSLLRRGAGKSLVLPISPTGGLQHNQKKFSWMG
jgi:hypothetical protein